MTHPNDMSVWDEISCAYKHEAHDSVPLTVDLSSPHGYNDYPLVPIHLVVPPFGMRVFYWMQYAVLDQYCPAHDAVSETIATLGIWEPPETIMVLNTMRKGDFLIDIGAQIGWFSLLALAKGGEVLAVDADAVPLGLLRASAKLNGWQDRLTILSLRIGPDAGAFPWNRQIRLAKIDVEGAEDQAIRALWPAIEQGKIDHLMVEISPVFADYYPELVQSIIEAGYEAYLLPPKNIPPHRLQDPAQDLTRFDDTGFVKQMVGTWHQANVWFKRIGAEW